MGHRSASQVHECCCSVSLGDNTCKESGHQFFRQKQTQPPLPRQCRAAQHCGSLSPPLPLSCSLHGAGEIRGQEAAAAAVLTKPPLPASPAALLAVPQHLGATMGHISPYSSPREQGCRWALPAWYRIDRAHVWVFRTGTDLSVLLQSPLRVERSCFNKRGHDVVAHCVLQCQGGRFI